MIRPMSVHTVMSTVTARYQRVVLLMKQGTAVAWSVIVGICIYCNRNDSVQQAQHTHHPFVIGHAECQPLVSKRC